MAHNTADGLRLEKARLNSERCEDHDQPRTAFSVACGANSSEEGEATTAASKIDMGYVEELNSWLFQGTDSLCEP